MNKPSFIAIGPPKTGTTWLYEQLKKHPQVALTPVKELGYFWEKAFLGDGGLLNLFNPFARFKKGRKAAIKNGWLAERVKSHVSAFKKKTINWSELWWDFRFFVMPHNDRWYQNLFDNDKVSGDISPMYALLPEKEIEAVRNLNPDVKIIISLRDPVERQWSRVRMKIKLLSNSHDKGTRPDQTKLVEQLIAGKEEKHNISSYDYVELVEKWSRFFPKENIFVFFYEELLENPNLLLNQICAFLKIESIDIGKAAHERVNKGIDVNLPDKYLDLLVQSNWQYLEKMPAYFSKPYPKQWLDKYNRLPDNSNVHSLTGTDTVQNSVVPGYNTVAK